MRLRSRKRLFRPALSFVFAGIALALFGCAPEVIKVAERQPAAEILVAVASDLKPALPELSKAFAGKTGIKIVAETGSSGILARQIENGAPMDVYLSANKTYIDQLTAAQLIGDAKPYAQGYLVLIGKAKSLEALAKPAVKQIAIANPEHAPYGQAAKEALTASGLWSTARGKLVYGENVIQASDLVKTGNADAGFVSLSLVKNSKTPYSPVRQELYQPIKQWAGVIKSSKNIEAAEIFIDFLMSGDARRILTKYGFKPAEEWVER